ncbi:unnamed protein product [Spirodela intermedia]|uniref:Uncharacterized protein n=1 Tax=Spirodela intermedia TaxID=51605 RepID=A0A7I8L5E1_SPIIN|nr:unnamed protein product [Spirodela intermedia]
MLGDCTDFGCAVSDSGGTAKDSADGSAESPQLKRRRMLQCNHDDPVEIICAGPSSEFLNPKTGEEATMGEDKTREEEQWDTELLDILGALGESSKCWLESCFNESEMRISSDETYHLILMIEIVRALVIMSNTPCNKFKRINYIDTSPLFLYSNKPPTFPAFIYLQGAIYLYWRPSYTKFPTTTASTVAYPFTLIKPCGARGEVTLEEINQILRTVRRP